MCDGCGSLETTITHGNKRITKTGDNYTEIEQYCRSCKAIKYWESYDL